MSAIFGIYYRDNRPVEPQRLSRMRNAMQHRIVDGESIRDMGNTSFGHLMLQTTPQSLFEQLPYLNNTSGLCITCDARLDNRDELIASLLPHIAQRNNIPDSHILLRAFDKWAEAMPEHLLGDFVFAIWNPDNQSLFLSRDHMGVKPLHYFMDAQVVIFASEVQAIHAAMPGNLSVNEKRVADYLLGYEHYDFESTFHNHVLRLAPAHSLMITQRQSRKQCYWTPNVERTPTRPEQEYVEEFDELLRRAVIDRLVSATPVGCLLSGGIDSSAVLAIGNQYGSQEIHSYSGVSADPDCMDSSCIKSVLAELNTPSEFITLADLTDLQDDLNSCFARLDDPFASPMTLAIALYTKASAANHRVILDGLEGDLVISLSRDYVAGLFRIGQWRSAISEIEGMISNGWTNSSFSRLLLSTLRSALPPVWLMQMRFRSGAVRQIKKELQDSLLSNSMISNRELADRYRKHREERVAPYRTLSAQHLWWVTQPFLAVALERYDRSAAVCGIEPRHPLMDKRIIEFCLALPWQLKVNDGWSKWILRQSIKPHLPSSVVWRTDKPHMGYGFSAQWMANNWQAFCATVNETVPSWSTYANPDRVLPYFDAHVYNHNETPEHDLRGMYFLAAWLRKFG